MIDLTPSMKFSYRRTIEDVVCELNTATNDDTQDTPDVIRTLAVNDRVDSAPVEKTAAIRIFHTLEDDESEASCDEAWMLYGSQYLKK